MGNMSYCRFENTSHDLTDCLDALYEMLNNGGRDSYQQVLGDREFNALESLVDTAKEIVQIADDVIELIEEARDDNN